MKYIYLTFIAIMALSCKAQTPVLSLYGTINKNKNNAYYKDIDNFQNQFVGTWLLDNGITYLKVKFIKKLMVYETSGTKHYYYDYLLGEYEYKLNSVTQVNTLNNLDVNHTNPYDYNLISVTIMDKYSYPNCTDCTSDEMRLVMDFNEPTRLQAWSPTAQFIIRKVIEGGVTKLKAQFVKTASASYRAPDNLKNFSLPYGDYTLIKQP